MADVTFVDKDERSAEEIEEEYGIFKFFVKNELEKIKIKYESASSKNIQEKVLDVYKYKKVGGDYASEDDPVRYLYCKDNNDGKYKLQLEMGDVEKRVSTKHRYTWRRISTYSGLKEIEIL